MSCLFLEIVQLETVHIIRERAQVSKPAVSLGEWGGGCTVWGRQHVLITGRDHQLLIKGVKSIPVHTSDFQRSAWRGEWIGAELGCPRL